MGFFSAPHFYRQKHIVRHPGGENENQSEEWRLQIWTDVGTKCEGGCKGRNTVGTMTVKNCWFRTKHRESGFRFPLCKWIGSWADEWEEDDWEWEDVKQEEFHSTIAEDEIIQDERWVMNWFFYWSVSWWTSSSSFSSSSPASHFSLNYEIMSEFLISPSNVRLISNANTVVINFLQEIFSIKQIPILPQRIGFFSFLPNKTDNFMWSLGSFQLKRSLDCGMVKLWGRLAIKQWKRERNGMECSAMCFLSFSINKSGIKCFPPPPLLDHRMLIFGAPPFHYHTSNQMLQFTVFRLLGVGGGGRWWIIFLSSSRDVDNTLPTASAAVSVSIWTMMLMVSGNNKIDKLYNTCTPRFGKEKDREIDFYSL